MRLRDRAGWPPSPRGHCNSHWPDCLLGPSPKRDSREVDGNICQAVLPQLLDAEPLTPHSAIGTHFAAECSIARSRSSMNCELDRVSFTYC